MDQSIREENNPVYQRNPGELKSQSQNENNQESDVLYTENTAYSTRMSACVKGSPSIKGHDVLEEEATYVAGNEPDRGNSCSNQPDITNKHHHNAENDDNPTPAPDVYVVSDKINAEDSAMYTASGENEESDPKAGNIDEKLETKVKQADSTVTMNLITNRNADRSRPDATENDADNETLPIDLSDDVEIEPYAVADMCDHETYLGTAASKASHRELDGSQTKTETDTNLSDIDMEPYAVTDMCENVTYQAGSDLHAQKPLDPCNQQFPNPMYGANVCQQASDVPRKDTGVHKLQNPPNANELRPNPIYPANSQQASEDSRKDTGVHKLQGPPNVNELRPNPMYAANQKQASEDPRKDTGVHKLQNPPNPDELQPNPTYGGASCYQPAPEGCFAAYRCYWLVALVVFVFLVGGITTGVLTTIYHNNQGIQTDGTDPPKLGTDGTNPPMGSTHGNDNLGTDAPICILGSTHGNDNLQVGTDPPILGSTHGNDNLQVGTDPRILGSTHGNNPPSLGTTHVTLSTKKPILCSTVETQNKDKAPIKFGGAGKGPCHFRIVGGLAVSSTNEIFVTDKLEKRIRVFRMNGAFLRSFPTENMDPWDIATGRNDSLWVVLQKPLEKFLYQMTQEGQVLAKCKFEDRPTILGLAVDKLSDKIILTIDQTYGSRTATEIVWFTPTRDHTPNKMIPTCKFTNFPLTKQQSRKVNSVAVDKKGNIFIVGDGIFRLDKDGGDLSCLSGCRPGAGNLFGPSGICVDGLGRIIVANTFKDQVEMFTLTADGCHVSTVVES